LKFFLQPANYKNVFHIFVNLHLLTAHIAHSSDNTKQIQYHVRCTQVVYCMPLPASFIPPWPCICRILDRVKSSKCDKQYNTWNNLWVSFRPHNHYDCCTRGWNSPSWS